jgi:hypothetical protein
MILTLLACASVELDLSPNPLALGEIDFAAEMPAEGYAVEDVTVTNVGKGSGTVFLPEYDTDRLCVTGFADDRDYPVELGPIEPDEHYVLPVAVCGYADGELGTEVETSLDVLVDDDPEPFTLTVTFTPVRSSDT